MMNKYLTKIARSNTEHQGSSWNSFGNTAVGLIGSSIISSPIVGAAALVGSKIRNSIHQPDASMADRHTIKKFLRDNPAVRNNVTFHKGSGPGIYKYISPGPAYLDRSAANFSDKHVIPHLQKVFNKLDVKIPPYNLNKSTILGVRDHGINHAVTMHELGHAKDFNTGLIKLKRASPLLKATGGLATVGMLSNKNTEDYAPIAAALPGLATLREEATANVHAYKGIKAHKGAKAANKFLTKLLPSQMGSYGLMVAAPVAGAYVAKKLIQGLRESEEPTVTVVKK